MSESKVCLIVIDGWGVSNELFGNAIAAAETPVMDAMARSEGQYITLDASGLAVGLPDGLMGNSEVGHLNIGAGRVIYQDIVRINLDVKTKDIHKNGNFVNACTRAKTTSNGRLHLLGLVSDGGVHAHINHLFSLLEGAKVNGVPNTYIHFFSDGRDTSPTSGVGFIQQVIDKTKELSYGNLSTIMGRYYAMDRDKRWERIQIAYEGLVEGKGVETTLDDVIGVVKSNYEANPTVTDEFLKPIIINKEGLIRENDTLVFIDYRADRMRQITETLGVEQHFEPKKQIPNNLKIYTMTQYKKEFPFDILYPPSVPKNVLAEVISSKGWPQYHCAETEKYAHVTFFFNGGQEKEFTGEERKMVQSPKVATYDLQPEMNAKGVGEALAEAIATKKYPFIMCNFAPPDMVGHTGKYEAAVVACAATDKAIGVVKTACEQNGYVLLVTADHGNAEKMYADSNKSPLTSHTTNRVPFIMANTDKKFASISHDTALCDVAPTVLDLLGIPIPEQDMTGKSLIAH
ncbi:2,3-bisphosphoglycerate-independent phosphoglycerate mutase-like [Oppia nitens]|uniref:2,3-bisphosphoglycerate-independent phosphoglycerate mutase-like n=1 Tax=Oppia nitens TaxID=1686743 RepID=UPI0023DBCE14|nr:2,3-bisphosphoglycerate-independent phosphoglycerate mutase-like [Oppia nitens]